MIAASPEPAASPGLIGPGQGPDEQRRPEQGDLDVGGGVDQRRMECATTRPAIQASQGRVWRDRPCQPHHAQHEQPAQDGLA